MDEATKELLKRLAGSAIRHLLTLASGWLVARGLLTEADATQLVVGLTPLVVAWLWSAWAKRREVALTIKALNARAGTTLSEVKQ